MLKLVKYTVELNFSNSPNVNLFKSIRGTGVLSFKRLPKVVIWFHIYDNVCHFSKMYFYLWLIVCFSCLRNLSSKVLSNNNNININNSRNNSNIVIPLKVESFLKLSFWETAKNISQKSSSSRQFHQTLPCFPILDVIWEFIINKKYFLQMLSLIVKSLKIITKKVHF